MFDNHSEDTQQGIVVDDVARYNMLEIGRWGKFLAIVGFVSIGLLILLGGSMMAIMPAAMQAAGGGQMLVGGLFGGFYFFWCVVIAAIYFYPTWALYKYSVGIKHAIAANDQHLFNTAFGHLKGAFKYIGIVTLIFICIYIAMFLFMAIFFATATTF